MYNHLYKQKINIKKINGSDSYGKPNIIETKENVPCKIEYKNKLLVSAQGQQITSTARVYTNETIDIKDVVNFPNSQMNYAVIQVSPMYDFDGKLITYEVLI